MDHDKRDEIHALEQRGAANGSRGRQERSAAQQEELDKMTRRLRAGVAPPLPAPAFINRPDDVSPEPVNPPLANTGVPALHAPAPWSSSSACASSEDMRPCRWKFVAQNRRARKEQDRRERKANALEEERRTADHIPYVEQLAAESERRMVEHMWKQKQFMD